MNEIDGAEVGFTAFLKGLADRKQRGALAALRRGLGKQPGEAAEMFPYLVPWTRDVTGWTEETYYLVASLFGLHPVSWQGRGEASTNFGASLARVAGGADRGGVERRFVALLNSRCDDLPDHLRHAVSLCKANHVPIDWLTLLRQLRCWNCEQRTVQRDWAAAFWRPPEPQDAAGTERQG